jgi:hypothetical protein
MPPIQDVHVDQVLSDYAFGVLQSSDTHIAGGFFPVQTVDKLSNKYYVLGREAFYRGEGRPRGSNQESAGVDFELSTDNYNCIPYALHTDVDRNKVRNADNPALYEMAATRLIVDNILLTHEIAWTAKYFVPGVWGTTVVGGTNFNKWSNYGTSDPEADFDLARRTVLVKGGREPNRVAIGYDAWLALKKHPRIVDRIKHVSADSITPNMVAALFGFERFVICKSTKATNAPGLAATFDFVQGAHVLVAYVGGNDEGELMPSAGRIFAWDGLNAGSVASKTVAVSVIDKPLHKSQRYEVEMNWDDKITGQQLGYFLQDAA